MTSTEPTTDGPVDDPDPRLIDDLRDDLDRADYSVDRLRRLWGDEADAALDRGDRLPAVRALRRPGAAEDRAGLLARLLLLGDPLDTADAGRALPRTGVRGAEALGLVASAGDRVLGAVDLRPYSVVDAEGVASWWVVSDLGELQTGRALQPDHVLGVGGASTTLAGLQLPDPAERALDLGTGSGIQALHASRYAEHVVATDVSARALRFARLTVALAGLRRVEFRRGDLFAPVVGERFDRIVSNPPFVITPRADGIPRYEYRDGGAEGDALLDRILAELPGHLAPGGVAQLLANWEYRTGDSPTGLDAVAARAESAGLEHWIVERDRIDPARYAETWIRDGGTRPGDPDWERMLTAWLDDFSRRGVDSIGVGYLLLRSPAGGAGPLRRAEVLPETLGANPAGLGAHLADALRGHDRIAGLGAEALDRLVLRVASDVTEERSHRPGAEHPSVIVLRQGGGFGRSIPVVAEVAAVVGACDGDLALGPILRAVAELTGQDAETVGALVRPVVRELVVSGVLGV